jgi:hypothetical protein
MKGEITAGSLAKPDYLAVKAVVAGFAVLVISALLARGVTAVVASTSAPHVLWGVTVDVDRIRELQAALPEIARRDEHAAFFVGPSVVWYGFSPTQFDASMPRGIDLRSYNAGINGNLPDLDALVARRIGDAYDQAGRRVRVTMIAFGAWAFSNWFSAVSPTRNRSKLVKSAALLTDGEVASLLLREPHVATEIVGVRLLGGLGAPDSIGLLTERWSGGPINGAVSPSWWFGAAPPSPDPYEQAVRDTRRGWASQLGRWDVDARGEFFQDRGDQEAYARLASFAAQPSQKRIQWYDDKIRGDMDVIPELFARFLDGVRQARRFSDTVAVVIMPTNPVAGRLNAAGRRRFEDIKAEIARQTGAAVIDLFEPPELTMADYIDISHLNERTGKPKFSALLADRIADLLASQKR